MRNAKIAARLTPARFSADEQLIQAPTATAVPLLLPFVIKLEVYDRLLPETVQ